MNKNLFKSNIVLCVFFFFLSIIIGWRGVEIGADTTQYISYYNSLFNNIGFYYEPFFEIISRAIYYLGGDYNVYFLFLALLFNFFWIKNFNLLVDGFEIKNIVFNSFLFLILSILSSWYFTATTNGLRQGLSLIILYFCFFDYFINKNKMKFIVILFSSILFHYSTILFLPFILLFKIKNKINFLIVIFILSFFYVLGLNEVIVKWISSLFGLDFYLNIKNYSNLEDNLEGSWVGFNLKLYLYSVFWIFLYLILSGLDKRFLLIKLYCILLCPYFVFGFGPFSNRYAFIAWLFLPFLQLVMLNNFIERKKVSLSILGIVLLILLFTSFLNFSLYFEFLEVFK